MSLAAFLGGIFGHSGRPYQKAMDEYRNWNNRAIGEQNPWRDNGIDAMNRYKSWMDNMKDPTEFMNKLISQYRSSPETDFLQRQAQNAGINSGSASGLSGSSPLMQQMQENAGNIANQGLNSWLQNIFSVNNQYGSGLDNLMNRGQHASDMSSNLYDQMGQRMGEGAYGKQAGRNQDISNMIGGGLDFLSGGFGGFGGYEPNSEWR